MAGRKTWLWTLGVAILLAGIAGWWATTLTLRFFFPPTPDQTYYKSYSVPVGRHALLQDETIYFYGEASRSRGVYRIPADGEGPPELVYASKHITFLNRYEDRLYVVVNSLMPIASLDPMKVYSIHDGTAVFVAEDIICEGVYGCKEGVFILGGIHPDPLIYFVDGSPRRKGGLQMTEEYIACIYAETEGYYESLFDRKSQSVALQRMTTGKGGTEATFKLIGENDEGIWALKDHSLISMAVDEQDYLEEISLDSYEAYDFVYGIMDGNTAFLLGREFESEYVDSPVLSEIVICMDTSTTNVLWEKPFNSNEKVINIIDGAVITCREGMLRVHRMDEDPEDIYQIPHYRENTTYSFDTAGNWIFIYRKVFADYRLIQAVNWQSGAVLFPDK